MMKYITLFMTWILNFFFGLHTPAEANSDEKKHIGWLDNPESAPLHDGNWEDDYGNTYSKKIDGNHYDQSGRELTCRLVKSLAL